MSENTHRCAWKKWRKLECITSSTTHMQVSQHYSSMQKLLPAHAHTNGNQAASLNQSVPNPKHVLRNVRGITRHPEERDRKRKTKRVKRLPNARTSFKSLQSRLKLRRATHHSFHARGAGNIKVATRSTKPSTFGEHSWEANILQIYFQGGGTQAVSSG